MFLMKKIIVLVSIVLYPILSKASGPVDEPVKEDHLAKGVCIIDFGEFRDCRGSESWVVKLDNKIIQCFLKKGDDLLAKDKAHRTALRLESNGLCLYIGEFQNE